MTDEWIPAPTEEGFACWRGDYVYSGKIIETDTTAGIVLTIQHLFLDKKGKRWWTR